MALSFLRRRRDPPLRPLERKLIEALATSLSRGAGALLNQQMALVNRVRRFVDDKEVNLYQIRRGKATLEGMPTFPLVVPEVKLATIIYASPGQPRPSRVDFWLVNGFVFSLQFSKSPRGVEADLVEIQEVKVLVDPMVPAETTKERSVAASALTGWLAQWAIEWQLSSLREPLPPEQRSEKLGQIEATVPPDYVELVSQTEGLQVDGCRVYGLSDVREVALPDATYYVLAEMEDRGVVAVRQGQSDGALFFFAYDAKPTPMGLLFREAVESLVRNEAA